MAKMEYRENYQILLLELDASIEVVSAPRRSALGAATYGTADADVGSTSSSLLVMVRPLSRRCCSARFCSMMALIPLDAALG
jgi:hypothetical protein